MSAMDKIEFRIVKASVPDFSKKPLANGISMCEMDVLDIFVNGKRLIDLARDVELPQAMKDQETGDKIAGSYVGFPMGKDWFLKRENIVKPYFLGLTDFSYKMRHEEDDPLRLGMKWTPLFTCAGCLEDGCWSLLAAIEPAKDLIRWAGLKHNHRKHWDYSKIGTNGMFTFERSQYEASLDHIEGQ